MKEITLPLVEFLDVLLGITSSVVISNQALAEKLLLIDSTEQYIHVEQTKDGRYSVWRIKDWLTEYTLFERKKKLSEYSRAVWVLETEIRNHLCSLISNITYTDFDDNEILSRRLVHKRAIDNILVFCISNRDRDKMKQEWKRLEDAETTLHNYKKELGIK